MHVIIYDYTYIQYMSTCFYDGSSNPKFNKHGSGIVNPPDLEVDYLVYHINGIGDNKRVGVSENNLFIPVCRHSLGIFGWYFQAFPEIYGDTWGYLMTDILGVYIYIYIYWQ